MRTSGFDAGASLYGASRCHPPRERLGRSRAALAPVLGWALTTGAVATEPLPLTAKATEVVPVLQEPVRTTAAIERHFPVGAVSRLHIDVPAGDVQIRAPDGQEQMELRVLRAAWHERCVLDVGNDGEGAWVRVAVERGRPVVPCKVDLRVVALRETTIVVQLATGDVRVSGLAGELTADIGAGDLLVDDLRGRLDAEMGSGQLLGVFHGPRLRAEVGSGLVRLAGMAAPADVMVGMGNVELSYLRAPTGTIDVRTGTGSVRVLLPPETPVRTALSVGMGSQEVGLPERPDAPTRVNVVTGMGRVSLEGRPDGE